MIAQALCGFKTGTILVYMILSDKGGLTGCGQYGYSLVSIFFNRSSNIAVFFFINKLLLLYYY